MKLRIALRFSVLTALLTVMLVLAASAAECGGSHTWDAGKIVWNADYTAAEGVWTCSACGDTHTEQADITSSRLTESTCQSAGRENLLAEAVFDSKHCISTKKIELPPLQHVYAKPTFHWNTVDFSCEAKWICTIGDETEVGDCDVTKSSYASDGHTPGGTIYVAYIKVGGETYIDTRTVQGNPVGHDYSDPVFYWSEDYTAARIESVCSICEEGDPERTISAECTINLIAKDADCFSEGHGTYIARADLLGQVWEDTKTVIYSRLQHDYPHPTFLWENGDCTVECECENCDTQYPADCTISVQKTYMDCVSPGKLIRTARIVVEGVSYSDSVEEEIPARGHAQIRLSGKESTCTEVGMTDGIGCSDCDVVLLAQAEIPASGHTDAAIVGTEATCTEDGMTDEIFCTVCKEILEKSVVIPAKGHTKKIIPGYQPTCTESGRGNGEICSVCEEVLVKQSIIPAAGHTSRVLDARKATCTENGYSAGEICSVCEAVLVEQTIFYAKGHTKVIQKGYAAACTREGLTDGMYCSVCRVILKEQTVIPAQGHKPKALPMREATCTEAGLTKGKICSVCQVILEEQQRIPAKGHTPQTMAGYAATCTESGLTEGKFCTVCQEVLLAQKAIPAAGHIPAKQDIRPATCTEPGYTEGNTCSVCREDFLTPGVIPPAGHKPQTIEGLDATCTEDGLTAGSVCSVCKIVLEEQTVVPAAGHQPIAIEQQDAACERAGFIGGSVCSVCQTELEPSTVIPPTGHTPVKKDGLAPTCTESGYTESVFCSVCNTVLEEPEILPALGHAWGEPIFIWSENHDRARAEKLCVACEMILLADVELDWEERMVNGTAVIVTTATASFSDGTTAVDEKTTAKESLPSDPGFPDTSPIDPPPPELESDPQPQPEADFSAPQFEDVAPDSYYYDAVAWAANGKITQGTADNIFSPDMICGRAQIVTMLWRAAGSPVAAGETGFADVPMGAYYYHAVLWAAEKGITSGTSMTTFSPELQCTRAQIVTMLWRAAGCPAVKASASFDDVAADAWYADAVAWAVEEGITLGTGAGIFSPDAVCTRAQIVTFLFRARNLL